MKKITKKLSVCLALFSAGLGALHLYRVRSKKDVILSPVKMVADALSPVLALIGAISAALGVAVKSPLAVIAGLLGTGLSADYARRVLEPRDAFERAFGEGWQERLPPQRSARMLSRRWQPGLPNRVKPRWERDIPFWTIPGTDRQLLCDIWQPPADATPSGLTVIYFHGSGWHFIDKDVGTRPMFRHLATQGHVVMDVAYRLCPEVNWQEMAGDPKRAVAWMKAQAANYGVDADRIVLAGGSAGGHLALLTAYAPDQPQLTPEDVADADLSVRGVISWYGPVDMRVYYTCADILFDTLIGPTAREATARLTDRIVETMGFDMKLPETWKPDQTVHKAMMEGLLGGAPEEAPEAYRLFSPMEHVGPHCPPTLLLQGEYDPITSAVAVHKMARMLRNAGVPTVYVEYPKTEHAFDLILPQISPPAQAALYEVDRFLALLAGDDAAI